MELNTDIHAKGKIKFKHFKRVNERLYWTSVIYFTFISLIIQFLLTRMFSQDEYIAITIFKGLTYGFFFAVIALGARKRLYDADNSEETLLSYTFNEKGITQERENRNESFTFQWSDVEIVRKKGNVYIIFFSNKRMLIVPNEFFNSQEDLNNFKQLVGEKQKK